MKIEFRHIEEFINQIDVECPNCQSKALVSSNPTNRNDTRFICSNCGRNKKWADENIKVSSNFNHDNIRGILLGESVDCYFRIPLWYKTDIKGETLFAYNLDHLEFIKSYVTDKLRLRKEDANGWSNRSLQSRLPKWILSSKNREIIERKIIELEKK